MKVNYDKKIPVLKKVKLGDLGSGSVFHFYSISAEAAVENGDVYMTTTIDDMKEERVTVVNIFDGSVMKRDHSHEVVEIDFTVMVHSESGES